MRFLQQPTKTDSSRKEPAKGDPGLTIKDGATKPKRRRRFPYRKVDELEADIAAEEARLRELEQRLASPDLYRDREKGKEAIRAFEETKDKLEQLYEHWQEAVELS
jgi:ATP-binding cassette subfamily F protein 3